MPSIRARSGLENSANLCCMDGVEIKVAVLLTTHLVDDVDRQTPASRTVHFSYGTEHFVIDLCEENAAKMDADFERWIALSRTTRPPKVSKSNRKPALNPSRVRAWARRNGFAVSDKGRIPTSVLDAYRNGSRVDSRQAV